MGYRDAVVGKYFSQEYIKKHILKLTQEEIEEMDRQIEAEKPAKDEDDSGGGNMWNEYDPSEDKPDLKVVSG